MLLALAASVVLLETVEVLEDDVVEHDLDEEAAVAGADVTAVLDCVLCTEVFGVVVTAVVAVVVGAREVAAEAGEGVRPADGFRSGGFTVELAPLDRAGDAVLALVSVKAPLAPSRLCVVLTGVGVDVRPGLETRPREDTSRGLGAATNMPPVLCRFSDMASCGPAPPYRLSLISSRRVITDDPVLSRRSCRRSFFSCQDILRDTAAAAALCCFSAALGWSRSGDKARRRSGDPGSQLLGRPMDLRAVGVRV